jgi:hypothetical protein
MAAKKTEKRGRKKVDPSQKIVPVTIWVRKLNLTRAQAACAAIANKYR